LLNDHRAPARLIRVPVHVGVTQYMRCQRLVVLKAQIRVKSDRLIPVVFAHQRFGTRRGLRVVGDGDALRVRLARHQYIANRHLVDGIDGCAVGVG
jgi:hypothetical protein